ncbi:hypothetical protein [Sphingobacterium daejeonense]|uniref:hypothetical protein n=1 Tax=Sphingobacterium daejeonense TaxID=371142 RepID=UPI0010C53719|nr:hypothetical protein [Sphingobacterium daejeonense]VTQ08508.1 Uncharacterised protein [Sphingobacterium daejeonense]
MRKISERLIVAVCGVLFLVGCSTAKKSKVLQSNTSVITPSVIVENSAPKLDTLNKTPAVVEQAKVAPPLAGANQTPEQNCLEYVFAGHQ